MESAMFLFRILRPRDDIYCGTKNCPNSSKSTVSNVVKAFILLPLFCPFVHFIKTTPGIFYVTVISFTLFLFSDRESSYLFTNRIDSPYKNNSPPPAQFLKFSTLPYPNNRDMFSYDGPVCKWILSAYTCLWLSFPYVILFKFFSLPSSLFPALSAFTVAHFVRKFPESQEVVSAVYRLYLVSSRVPDQFQKL